MAVERRELIRILGVGLAASPAAWSQHRHEKAQAAVAAYVPRALTAAEYTAVDQLADIILPPDAQSPGAHEAAVARYIDIVLLYGDKPTLAAWKRGVEELNAAAKAVHGAVFAELSRDRQIELVTEIATHEVNPQTPMQALFVSVKRIAIEAYYLSAAGKQSLGYKGDTAVANFPGCTHPEHWG